jgi:hypothetical protein
MIVTELGQNIKYILLKETVHLDPYHCAMRTLCNHISKQTGQIFCHDRGQDDIIRVLYLNNHQVCASQPKLDRSTEPEFSSFN